MSGGFHLGINNSLGILTLWVLQQGDKGIDKVTPGPIQELLQTEIFRNLSLCIITNGVPRSFHSPWGVYKYPFPSSVLFILTQTPIF